MRLRSILIAYFLYPILNVIRSGYDSNSAQRVYAIQKGNFVGSIQTIANLLKGDTSSLLAVQEVIAEFQEM